MLATWALKCYGDIMRQPKDDTAATFSPVLL
jgi:hypothetical protein